MKALSVQRYFCADGTRDPTRTRFARSFFGVSGLGNCSDGQNRLWLRFEAKAGGQAQPDKQRH
jgi:hypothetical protein